MADHPNQWMFTENYSPDGAPAAGKASPWTAGLIRFFRFFASVKLAVPIILSLMVILAAGTIAESLHGADAAKLLVYDTWWFALVLILLGINVLGAVLDRIPWKKKHTGFVITHFGIITILVGSFMTKHMMIDGQMPVAEGESGAYVTVAEPLVYVLAEKAGKDAIVPVPKKPLPWEGSEKLRGPEGWPFEIRLLHYYPKARVAENVAAAEEGPLAVQLTLHNSFVNQQVWLREKDAARSAVELGPARIVLSDTPLQDTAENSNGPRIEVIFEKDKRIVRLPLPDAFPAKTPLEGTPYSVTLTRVLKNAVVHGRELSDEPVAEGESEWKNPAVELVLEGEAFKENHTVFAKFPDFPTAHGMKPSTTGAVIRFRIPSLEEESAKNELRLVNDPQKGLLYQIQTGSQITAGVVRPGENTPTGWMDLNFRVDQVLPHSRIERVFSPQPNTSEAEDLVSGIEIEVTGKDLSKKYWLAAGLREKFSIGDETYHVLYGQRRIPLGFKIELKDFKIDHYPGTDKPAGFSSDVVLKDDMHGIVRDAHISMNNPLVYKGFHVYQAAYSLNPGEPEISVFAVGRDPGVPVKYAGSIILIAGIVTMFSMRRFHNPKAVKT